MSCARAPLGRRANGFTLIEVLVAVLAFGLLAAATYTGLSRMAEGAGQLDGRAERLAGLQRAVATLDQDLRQLVSRAAPGPDGRTRPALAGSVDGWVGHRSGRWLADERGSVLQTVAWSCTGDGRLERRAAPDAAAALPVGPDPRAQRFAVGCRAFRLRYRDALGQWHERWPVDAEPAGLPAAVEYAFESDAFGTIRRLVVL
ncbi:type II secretion system minor pseudopilin GspJ [Wenzhouxiangella sp. XN79A]|uniref:type II secretion system minor pseudopilin GspJ n=1 Tax=Wenzhouxiangella sp. XN79A TaxID=2724193 RepID=UPI00144A8FBB|nr:type II secretion system minor pseudopilin GspJ [Wenzhouxiangella sp. XN79A]NKI35670.1 type II secretion system minor pseudopilin GspJ [Wenzhouxiangella sp. XN79A]